MFDYFDIDPRKATVRSHEENLGIQAKIISALVSQREAEPGEAESKRQMLRHFLAALAYRGTNVLRDMPQHIPQFRPSPSVRTPVEILNHLNGVLTYARSFLVPYESTEPPLLEWSGEVDRFYEIPAKLDQSLAGPTPLRQIDEEDLLQGPFADAMLHLGQIGIFRRMAGSPVAAENYVFADVTAGHLVRCNG